MAVVEGCRKNREGHLLAAFFGRHRRHFTHFQVPEDILQHDHRIIDQARKRQGQSTQASWH